MKIAKKDINGICHEIDLIIEGKDNKIDYKYIYYHLEVALTKAISLAESELICQTIIKIAKTKNRTIRHLEKDFWNFVNKILFQIIIIQDQDIDDNEELLPNWNYENKNKQILSRLLGMVHEILDLKDDNSKGSDLRRAGSLKFIAELITYYQIPDAKKTFVNSINSKNTKEQYEALLGLENYYDVTEDKIEADLVKALNKIKKATDDRTVASTCLQIQINAGKINELTAVFEIDDWKAEKYNDK